jgi:hypothetical protein
VGIPSSFDPLPKPLVTFPHSLAMAVMDAATLRRADCKEANQLFAQIG